jgi:DNA-binding Lrp family transcriptional regulator
LDLLDKALLLELSLNCRCSYSVLASKYGVSPNTIKNRVQNLEKKKIILGFALDFNYAVFNANPAVIFFKFIKKTSDDIIKQIGNHELVKAVGISLESGFALVHFRNNQDIASLNDFFHSFNIIDVIDILPLLLPLNAEISIPKDDLKSLQPIDWLIIYHLRLNGRIPLSTLAKKTGITVKTIRKRLESLKKKSLISLTILLNPGAISQGLMVIFSLKLPKVTKKIRYDVEKKIREINEENFWVSWQVVDRPIILLGFQAANVSEVKRIKNDILKTFPNIKTISQVIGGEMIYFTDFTDQILEEKKNQGWFSPEQWECNDLSPKFK